VTEPCILLTTDVIGGVWDFCAVLARALGPSARVALLTLGSPTSAQRQTAAEGGAQLIEAPLRLEWMADAQADIVETRRMVKEIAREVGADVIHANQFAAACADVDVPVVLTLHSDVLSWRRWTCGADEVPPEWESYSALVREALARADAVVAVSAFLAREIAQLYTCDRPIEVIHNGWPPSPGASVPSAAGALPCGAVPARFASLAPGGVLNNCAPEETLREPAAPGPTSGRRNRITFMAGRIWDAAKNIPLAAEAAQGWDPGEVYLAGEPSHPEGGHAAVAAPLRPLGFLQRAEMEAWLRTSAVYLSPARYDPFGLLPLQAALSGCALLLSDIPSYREVWDGAACFFRSNDAADLRRHWRMLLDDPQRLEKLQHDAYQRASTRYTAESVARAYRGVYARVTKRVAA
jgi:glycosyltransferase involved in cell wall biosynthesis